jgi:hypothetical protein
MGVQRPDPFTSVEKKKTAEGATGVPRERQGDGPEAKDTEGMEILAFSVLSAPSAV